MPEPKQDSSLKVRDATLEWSNRIGNIIQAGILAAAIFVFNEVTGMREDLTVAMTRQEFILEEIVQLKVQVKDHNSRISEHDSAIRSLERHFGTGKVLGP